MFKLSINVNKPSIIIYLLPYINTASYVSWSYLFFCACIPIFSRIFPTVLYISQRKWSGSFIVVASWFRESLLEPSTVPASVWTGCSAALLHGCHPDSSGSIGLSAVSDSLWPHGPYSHRLPCPWDSPDKNTGVGCHSLLQGIFLTQGLNGVFCIAGNSLLTEPLRETVMQIFNLKIMHPLS